MSQQRETIDTYLLRVLDTVLTERSVTKAAILLNQSQPAISAALRRLRTITGDPLLVRGKNGMVPTEHGLRMLEPARRALHEIDQVISRQTAFDPATSVRAYRIACPDYLSTLFVPTLVSLFRALAPHATLDIHSLGPALDYEVALETGKVDVVVGNWPEPPEQLHLSNLFADRIVCLVSRRHPLAAQDALSVNDYLNAGHLAPTPYSVGQRGAIDLHLMRERLKRRVVVTLPYFNLVPYVLAESDLLFTTTQIFADHYVRLLPLKVLSAPPGFPAMRYYQLWHERTHRSDEVRWLRGLIADAAQRILANSSLAGQSVNERSLET
ncbi:LysR substrate-binding domain-containing protein [Robbsia sp. Bb-Pol-6]|uniref:LysR substrate-binding domain-containing protein n=1 Tax=Robbsia betulipollinis TaxID=2981849 RepID=A0ABT3ZGW3_9BURK|nr:LysR substrate-binding domain-containing protein [Robbsia betulipollinis]MCY0385764.1 LysR substrate-binding domain-containing protein [Robbsia betulipollinis]